MAETVLPDELHVAFRVPGDLPDAPAEAVRLSLAGDDFMDRVRRAVRAAVRASPEIAVVRVSPDW